jgi:hypothetical protein
MISPTDTLVIRLRAFHARNQVTPKCIFKPPSNVMPGDGKMIAGG